MFEALFAEQLSSGLKYWYLMSFSVLIFLNGAQLNKLKVKNIEKVLKVILITINSGELDNHTLNHKCYL